MGKLHDMAGGGVSGETGILTIDDFTSQFDKKTQYAEFFEPKQESKTADEIPNNLIDPDGAAAADEQPGGGVWNPDEEEHKPVNPERFAKTGYHIAKLFDTGFDLTMSNLVAKGSGNSYHASEKDIDDLGEAWGELAEDKQWELGPGLRVALLTIAIYIPLARKAFEDRRIMELERRADDTERILKEQAAEIKRLKDEQYRRNNENGADNTAGSTEASGAKA